MRQGGAFYTAWIFFYQVYNARPEYINPIKPNLLHGARSQHNKNFVIKKGRCKCGYGEWLRGSYLGQKST